MTIAKINKVGFSQIDSNTKLLLHFNGEDGGTSIIDSSGQDHNVTVNGGAELDTAEKKFGNSSVLFSNTSDYLTIPYSSDFEIISDTTDYTIDLWVKSSSGTPSNQSLVRFYTNASNLGWKLYIGTNGKIYFWVYDTGYLVQLTNTSSSISDTNFHHIALIKVEDKYGLYLDGNCIDYVQDTSTKTFGSGTLYIGMFNDTGEQFYGHIDELRIQASNYFNANPDTDLTDTITVPTKEYSSIGLEKFQKISFDDIAKINKVSK